MAILWICSNRCMSGGFVQCMNAGAGIILTGSAADQVTIVRKNHRKGAFGLFGHAEAGFVSLTVIALKVLQQVQ